jgi:hypothetical protein
VTSPAVGIAYMLWLRLRWGAAATVMYLFALSVAAQFLPADPMIMALTLLTAAIAHLLHVFTLGPADFGVKSSGYPANMFVLPLRTRTLTGWPILYGAATFAMLWVLVVYLVLKPIGFSPPVLWPAAIAAASAAWVQAIGWAPFPTPFARVPVLALAAIPLILLGTWAAIYMESRSVAAIVTAGSLIWVAIAHGFAVLGLARARCGAESTWSVVPEKIRAAVVRRHASIFNLCRQFPSASAAQLWHEFRRNAVFLPAMMAFIGLPLLALNCFAVLNPTSDRTMLFGTISVTPATMSLLIWIFVPLMLASSLGQGLGKFDMWGKETMPSFFAIRPMSTTRYVVLKMIAVAASAFFSWAILWFFLALWAFVEASSLNSHESIVRAALANSSSRQAAIAVIGLIGLVAVTWRAIATGIWPTLTGRKSVATSIAFASWGSLVVAAIVGSWVYRHPEIQARLEGTLPGLVSVLLLLKFAAAAAVGFWLRKLGMVESGTAAKCLAGWCAVVVGLLLGLSQVVQPNWLMAGWVVLLVPLARMAVAPLALHLNRHR